LNHPHIVTFYGICVNTLKRKMCLVTELCDGTLKDVIEQAAEASKAVNAALGSTGVVESAGGSAGANNATSNEDENTSVGLGRSGGTAEVNIESMGSMESVLDSQDAVYHIALSICSAMVYLEQMSVVHADLKPANVLLKFQASRRGNRGRSTKLSGLRGGVLSLRDGREVITKLCDFGLARVRRRHRSVTTVRQSSFSDGVGGGDMVGGAGAAYTPLYAAPEVILGYSAHNLSSSLKQDVFSFGLIFFQLCTKVHELYPNQKWSAQVVELVANEGLRPAFPENSQVSELDRALITECLAGNPEERPSFREVIRQLTKRLR
jgi:serine/threonine protein kinase